MKKSKDKKNDKRYTMRNAFKQWLILHGDEQHSHGKIRIPHWFRHYIRKNHDWSYVVENETEEYYCNKCEMTYEQRRQFKGYYKIHITDEELLQLQKPEKLD